jgi:hypothetical protein
MSNFWSGAVWPSRVDFCKVRCMILSNSHLCAHGKQPAWDSPSSVCTRLNASPAIVSRNSILTASMTAINAGQMFTKGTLKLAARGAKILHFGVRNQVRELGCH